MTQAITFNPKNKKSIESAIEKILVLQAVSKGLQDKDTGKMFSHKDIKNRKRNV